PIIHEPIHTLTNGKLVAAITEAGGLGTLGINAGYQVQTDASTSASITNSGQVGTIANNSILDAMQERNLMNEQIDQVLASTYRPFGVEVASLCSHPDDDHTAMELVKLMRKRRLTIALFEGFGRLASHEWVQLFHNKGIKVMQVVDKISDVRLAIDNGCDVLICKSKAELTEFVRVAASTPVLAGYDTTNPNALTAALAHGAQGVFLKTIFATAKEAPTAQAIKDLIVKTTGNELVEFSISGQPVFSISGKLPAQLAKMTKAGEPPENIFVTANGYQGLINGMANGDLITGYTDIAPDIEHITAIETTEQIINKVTSRS
ncbi:hypothetical protein EQ500_02455, partial [Lactobacillus sp. XV13L]|nr:hypothetical protein [Lactobacillus sp. XV13L]